MQAIVSNSSINKTARTRVVVANQRAQDMYTLGAKSVIELCCGPSLKDLHNAYLRFGISCVGNDIQRRYADAEPALEWRVGDCFDIPIEEEVVIFAPPLSSNCTGTRADSLQIDQVRPSYRQALKHFKVEHLVLVLPGRSLSTKSDKSQFYALRSSCYAHGWIPTARPRIAGCVKYIDLILMRR